MGLVGMLSSVLGEAPSLPNIILLMGDDHGWEETSYYDHPHVKTPVLDEMAASGLRLDHFYAAHPTCSPTRGSVLTGRHPNRYGTFTPNHSIRPEEITLAHLLKPAGYRCGHFGKWHVGPVKASSPTNPKAMGFDRYVSHDNFFELNPPLSRDGGPPKVFEGESSAVIVEEARRFIEAGREEGRPFFVVIWFGSPHEPYSGLPEDLALYDDLPKAYPDRTVRLTSNETGRPVKRPLGEVLRERYAEITAMDRAIGTLRSALKEMSLRDNTLLWYCGDNGTPSSGYLASPFRGLKGQLYEGGIRVPGIIEWPGRLPQGRVYEWNAVTSDMLPTLCALAGVALPERPLDGIDLMPLIEGKAKERAQSIEFWSYAGPRRERDGFSPYIDPELQRGTTPLVKLSGGVPTRNFRNDRQADVNAWTNAGHRVILQGRHKLHVRDGKEGREIVELYDLKEDPKETTNLARERQDLAETLSAQLRAWQASVRRSLAGADYGG
jgi:arylsulfatase A-like enzyme